MYPCHLTAHNTTCSQVDQAQLHKLFRGVGSELRFCCFSNNTWALRASLQSNMALSLQVDQAQLDKLFGGDGSELRSRFGGGGGGALSAAGDLRAPSISPIRVQSDVAGPPPASLVRIFRWPASQHYSCSLLSRHGSAHCTVGYDSSAARAARGLGHPHTWRAPHVGCSSLLPMPLLE